jgi:hypothetical protein
MCINDRFEPDFNAARVSELENQQPAKESRATLG